MKATKKRHFCRFFVFCFVGKNLYYPQYFVEQYYRNNVYNPENHRAEDQHQYCQQSCDQTFFCKTADKSVNCPDNVKYRQCQNYFDDFGQRVKAFYNCVHNSTSNLVYNYYTPVKLRLQLVIKKIRSRRCGRERIAVISLLPHEGQRASRRR